MQLSAFACALAAAVVSNCIWQLLLVHWLQTVAYTGKVLRATCVVVSWCKDLTVLGLVLSPDCEKNKIQDTIEHNADQQLG